MLKKRVMQTKNGGINNISLERKDIGDRDSRIARQVGKTDIELD